MTKGGSFLLQPVAQSVFTREMFSEEQREIDRMVREFARERIFPRRDELGTLNKELTLELMHEVAELGLTAIDIPERFGGLEQNKTTAAMVNEALTSGASADWLITFSCPRRHRLAAPGLLRHGGAEGEVPAEDRQRRLHRRVRAHRAGRRIGRHEHPDLGEADRGRRGLRIDRRQAVHHQRRLGRPVHGLRAARRQGHDRLSRRARQRGADPSARKRARWGSRAPPPST